MALEGDVGARHLIGAYQEVVTEVPVENAAVMTDIDTPDALRAAREIERV
jgi:molybdenum cofactor cytidylyltransferase